MTYSGRLFWQQKEIYHPHSDCSHCVYKSYVQNYPLTKAGGVLTLLQVFV